MYTTLRHLGEKPKQMQILGGFHVGETHEYGYEAVKARNIVRANLEFEPTLRLRNSAGFNSDDMKIKF